MRRQLKILGLLLIPLCFGVVGAQYSIIPKGNDVSEAVSGVGVGGEVMENYKKTAETLSLPDQMKYGIINWNTILDYCVYFAKFLGQVALLVGALALIYLGYEKIWKSVKGESTPFTKIVIGILVVIFAYVIVKLIRSAFIS